MKNNPIFTIVLVIIFAGIGFFAGTKYQQGQTRATFTQQFGNRINGGNGNNPNGRFRNGGGQIVGQISNVDNNTMTVKMADGSSKIVILSAATAINKTSQGTVGDLQVGTRVGVFGTPNSDGSVTAQNILINPFIRGEPTAPTSTVNK